MTPTKAPDADPRWEWEELGWIALDAGVCFFGARATLPSGRRLPLTIGQRVRTHSALLATSDGYRLVACGTAADLSMPVEVALVNGRRVAARMEFVDDVAEVGGVWEVVGTFELPRGVTAGDPMCAGGTYRVDFDIEPGTYRADIFKPAENPWDTLGLRIVLIETAWTGTIGGRDMADPETLTSEKTFTGVRYQVEIPVTRSRRTVIDLSNRPLLQTSVSDEEREAFARLEGDDAFGWIRTPLATYVAETVHDPVRLQGLWTLSAFPFEGRRLFTLSVGGVEVLWMHGHDFVVRLNVAHGEALRHMVDEVSPDVWHRHSVYDSIERHCPVRGLLVTDANALTNLLSDPTVLDAAYRLNALLMHYGGTGLSRFHNRPFATAVLERSQLIKH